jgi:hypothetical protein
MVLSDGHDVDVDVDVDVVVVAMHAHAVLAATNERQRCLRHSSMMW